MPPDMFMLQAHLSEMANELPPNHPQRRLFQRLGQQMSTMMQQQGINRGQAARDPLQNLEVI